MGTLLRRASKLLNWISNHSAAQLPLEKTFNEKGGMIYTNICPPKKLSVNNVLLSSPEKQDLSDFLSLWYLKYKQIKTKNNRCFSTKELFICAWLFIKKKGVTKKSNYKPMLKTFLCRRISSPSPLHQHSASDWSTSQSAWSVKRHKSGYFILLCFFVTLSPFGQCLSLGV